MLVLSESTLPPQSEKIITLTESLLPVESYRRFADFYRAYQQSKESGLDLPLDIAARTSFIKRLMEIYQVDLMEGRDSENGDDLPENVVQILESVGQIMPAPADLNFEERLTCVIDSMNLLLKLSHHAPQGEAEVAAQILASDHVDDDGNSQEIDLLPTDEFNAVFTARMRELREKVQTVFNGGFLITVSQSSA